MPAEAWSTETCGAGATPEAAREVVFTFSCCYYVSTVMGIPAELWVIKDGRDAAAAMKTYLENIEIKKSKVA